LIAVFVSISAGKAQRCI